MPAPAPLPVPLPLPRYFSALILRRAARYARQLDQHEPFIYKLVDVLADTMGEAFPEIVERSAAGLIAEANAGALADSIDKILSNPSRYNAYRKAAVEAARQQFSIDVMAKRMVETLEKHVGKS